MAQRPMALVRRWLRQTVAPHDDGQLTDRDLLRRFAVGRDEAAFAVLVRRHGTLVVTAAQRVLGDAHAAEDVGQAAFLLLAKKATAAGWQSSVANWLYTTARQLALKAQTADRRRRQRERSALRPSPTNPLAALTAQELLTVLDEELGQLPERLRAPLLLCYFEGATRDEAAHSLNCPLATVKHRLTRGRAALRAALVRRGLSLPAVLAGGLLVHEAAPFAAASSWANVAAQLAAGRPATELVTPAIARLIQEGLTMAGRKSLKLGLAVAVAVGLLAFAARDQLPAANEPATVRTLRVVVLDAQGRPLPGAQVQAGVWTGEPVVQANRERTTDAAGTAKLELPAAFRTLRLWVGKPSFVTLVAQWEQAEELPAECRVRLEAGATVRGRVVDDAGQPVAGASVRVRLATELPAAGADPRWRYEAARVTKAAADGRWQIDTLPPQPQAKLSLFVTHPDFAGDAVWRPAEPAARFAPTQAEEVKQVLPRDALISGRVTDPAGRPLAKVHVVVDGLMEYLTDDDGRYQLARLPPGLRNLLVYAPGFAPQLRRLNLVSGSMTQDFPLKPGQPLRVRVVDTAGAPVPGVSVAASDWQRILLLWRRRNPAGFDLSIPPHTDAAGRWEWADAPAGVLQLSINYQHRFSASLSRSVGEPEQTIELDLAPRATVTCRVVDARTGRPVPEFTVYHDSHRSAARTGREGQLAYPKPLSVASMPTDPPGLLVWTWSSAGPPPDPFAAVPFRLRVEAPGYRRQQGPSIPARSSEPLTQEFRLQPSPPVSGIVLDPAGRPAANLTLLVATPTEPVTWADEFSGWVTSGNHEVVTDAAGRFTFPDPGEPFALIVRAKSGFAYAEFPADRHDVGALRLQPWAVVRGRVSNNGVPVRQASVSLTNQRPETPDWPRFIFAQTTVADQDGRFEFTQVPPIPLALKAEQPLGPSVPLSPAPGHK